MVLLIIVIGGYFYYQNIYNTKQVTQKNTQQTAINADIAAGRDAQIAGDGATAVPILEKTVAQAQDQSTRAFAQIVLAAAYITAGRTEDGVNLYKSISLDTTVPALWRALAGQHAIEYYLGGKDIAFARTVLFTGPTWGTFLDPKIDGQKGIDTAVINGLIWVTSLAPSYGAEYELASKYADLVLQGGDADTVRLNSVNATTHIQKGDAAIKSVIANGAPAGDTSFGNRVGVAMEHKAITLDELYQAKAITDSADSVISAYNDSISMVEKDPTLKIPMTSGLYARYHLATFMMHVDSVKYANTIADTLNPLYGDSLRTMNFYTGFLKLYGSDPQYKNSLMWKDMVALSKLEPKFKELLLQMGWNSADLK
ncbi:MAG: hypothetical protein JWO50_364 [Candidatus Kaiserbacteria bacterium]|nr:hypothetical protein [Candidatus Kaiserbacteria bacterium]